MLHEEVGKFHDYQLNPLEYGYITARFRCVFGSTDGYGVWKYWVSLG